MIMNGAASYWTRSKWFVLVSMAIVLLSVMPQFHLWFVRGAQWQGAYTILQGDELLYSSYVNALMDGRPRRTDPATGQDDHSEVPLPESLFSIQFIPPYVIAGLATLFGFSASSAFVTLLGVAGFLASLSIYWLLASVSNDRGLAAVGVLVVLCFGALAGGQGLLGLLLKPDVRFLGMPFLRRYEPAAPFPLFFIFCTLIWFALTTATKRIAIITALSAGVTLGVLIFSYFFLWTAAAAWLFTFACLWMVLRPRHRARAASIFGIALLPVVIALGFYAYLLSRLPPGFDKAQVLTFTHAPDLLRIPEIIGAFILVGLILAVRTNRFSFQDPKIIFVASLALSPFVIFNQQVITGRSIQPFHYEILIANYLVLVGVVITIRFLQPSIPRRTIILIVSVCLCWGTIEVNISAPVRTTVDVKNDQMVPVLRRLRELASTDGTWEALRDTGKASALVFSPEYGISRLLPTWAPQGLLLGTGSAAFQSLSEATRKEWLYTHYYYCGRNMEYVRGILNDQNEDPFLTYYAKSTTFGPERVLLFLGLNTQPITQEEIEREVTAYGAFVDSFSRELVIRRPIAYAITSAQGFDFSYLDLWYERDAGEQVGAYILYRMKLRQ
ncbi:MAG: hypothetical protein ABR568_07170 [Pyrinomonadaceae bacterium]